MWDLLVTPLKALRKLIAFLANLFPQVRLPRALRSFFDRLGARPGWQRARARLADWRVTRAFRLIAVRFIWRDYRGDRVVLSELPPDVATPLRAGLTFAAVALLLILYSTRFTAPAVDASSLGIDAKQVSAVTIYLAALGLTLGLGAILAGAARSNYPTLLFALVFSAFVLAGLVGSVKSKGFYGLVGLAPLWLVLAQSGALLRQRPLRRLLPQAALAYLGGIVIWRTSMLSSVSEPWLTLIGLGATLLAGSSLHRGRPMGSRIARAGLRMALLVLCYAGLRVLHLYAPALLSAHASSWPELKHPVAIAGLSASIHVLLERIGDRPQMSARRLFGVCCGLLTLLILELGLRLGHADLLRTLDLSVAYAASSLWMVWYFVAVGIAYKLLKETKTIVDAGEILAPGRLLAICALLLMLAGLLCSFAGDLLDLGLSGALPQWISMKLARFGLLVERLPPAWYSTLGCMRPVMVLSLAALAYLALRKQLDRSRLLAVTFLTLLAFLAIYEYHFELFAFARASDKGPRTGALFFFGLWILWLIYSVGMRIAQTDSPRFPRAARTALFVGLLALIANSLHLQAVLRPRALADQTYLEFFHGLINIGLPYFLYIYLSRRHSQNAIPVHRMAAAFFLGGLLQAPAALFAKLAASGYSLGGLVQTVRTARDQLIATGQLPAGLTVPASFGASLLQATFQELLKLVGVVAVLVWLRRSAESRRLEAPVYAIAIGLGFSSAAIIAPWFPLLPPTVVAALFPLELYQELTVRLVTHHLFHLLPAVGCAAALVIALGEGGSSRRRCTLALGATCALCILLRASATVLDRQHRTYLTSTGLEWVYLLLPLLLSLALFIWLERRLAPHLDAARAPVDSAPVGSSAPASSELVPASHLRVAFALGLIGLAVLGGVLSHRGRMITLADRPLPLRLSCPATWRMEKALPGTLLTATRAIRPGERVQVLVALEPRVARGASLVEAAATLDRLARLQLPDLQAVAQNESHLGEAPALGRMLRFTLPAAGFRMEYVCHQVIVWSKQGLLVLSYLGSVTQFARHHDDFRRMLSSASLVERP